MRILILFSYVVIVFALPSYNPPCDDNTVRKNCFDSACVCGWCAGNKTCQNIEKKSCTSEWTTDPVACKEQQRQAAAEFKEYAIVVGSLIGCLIICCCVIWLLYLCKVLRKRNEYLMLV